ncbi:MAG: NADH-quinone oxidoreductase subunit L [Pseudomonadales bacterium]|nr:NADH-quinone oxidoreductase subunit L [Pseudomonadales bacterium]MDP6472692.1 NADH-quinone oxidoreductase subunit L [Pseudomonadales bacterium]MDP6827903.1 NADH-quinone oxidoreductase subunit L [Pseudomonadales bacterium]MDP6973513.1 NADH-quinone oxidoreductase subunit L [Pseudomonadales bacterium]
MDWLTLVPVLPLTGFLVLLVTQGRLGKLPVAIIGAGSVGLAALAALLAGLEFYAAGAEPRSVHLWTWMAAGTFRPEITLYLDGLSLVMTGVITGVGFLIHLYATGYMASEGGYSRFFAYMNLFVFAMLMLVLGDNLLVLFLGWEGVGLCSYLLIGFFHDDPANGYAARKAFVVTRVGDTFMAIGLFLLFRELGSLEIRTILTAAIETWPDGSTLCTAIALLLLGGAVGKSAQVPLQTWLPDAMAGPTPVSALIHAATMVTAGVYLIARMHDLFLLSPLAQTAVAVVGLVTLFISSFTALTQRDIKRVLAYSTMSQIGYMFLALGVGAWSAAIFHLVTHAFFKALLFLAAGSVILSLHHEQDMFRMGGLWKRLPIPFWSMVIGSAALAALPLTSGFYSKDLILLGALDVDGGAWFWGVAALAAFMTTLYTVRMMVLTFFGEVHTEPHDESGASMNVPLIVLAVLAVAGGWFGLAPVAEVLPDGGVDGAVHEGAMVWITALVPIAGLVVGYLVFVARRIDLDGLIDSGLGRAVARFWHGGWGFDTTYEVLVVRPFVMIAHANRSDAVDFVYRALAALARAAHHVVAATQTGRLRWYAANMAGGLVIALVIVMLIEGLS